MKKMITVIVFLCLLSSFAYAVEDIYISQTSQGADSGADCSNAHSVVWFNASGNWANPKTAGKIGPGDTAHLCGTITDVMIVQKDGSSGAPITILFEHDAKLSRPAAALFVTDDHSYITLDGGTNGIVENTDNGTDLTYHVAIRAIDMSGSNNEVKNLTIQNIYVITSPDDPYAQTFSSSPTGIYAAPHNGNLRVHDNTFDDICWCITVGNNPGTSGLYVYNNTFTKYDHGVTFGGATTPGFSGAYIYNNHFGTTAIWDVTNNTWHHDGIHLFHGTTSTISNVFIYNNLFDGDWGNSNTAQIFIEGNQAVINGGISNLNIYNNVLMHTNSRMNNGSMLVRGVNTSVLNNTVICPGSAETDVGIVFAEDLSNGLKFMNNLITGCAYPISSITGTTTNSYIDTNLYADVIQTPQFTTWRPNSSSGYSYLNFTTWKSSVMADEHSTVVANAGIDSSGHLISGSSAINAGNDLTSLGISTLNADKDGIARPQGAAWDIGAYEYASVGDVTSPTVDTLSVSESIVYLNKFIVSWTCSDAVGVTGQKWRADAVPNASNGTALTSSPQTIEGTLVSGDNDIYVGCYDAAGNYGTAKIPALKYVPSTMYGVSLN